MKPTFKNSHFTIESTSTSPTFNEDKLKLEIERKVENLRKFAHFYGKNEWQDLEKTLEYSVKIDIQKNCYPKYICGDTEITIILISYNYKSILPKDIENSVTDYFLDELTDFCKNEVRLYMNYSLDEWQELIKRGNDAEDSCYNYIKEIHSDGLICGYLIVNNEE